MCCTEATAGLQLQSRLSDANEFQSRSTLAECCHALQETEVDFVKDSGGAGALYLGKQESKELVCMGGGDGLLSASSFKDLSKGEN
jgi:hypothetical protein